MSEVEVKCNKNGPLIVRGEFQLLDSEGNGFDLGGRKQIALCRCGKSDDKPFCDGSHNRAGFESTVVCRALPPRK
jgi:CDGSH-type Zn-finger protein